MRVALVAAALLLLALPLVPSASADPIPDPQCAAIYQEIISGPPLFVAMTSGCSFRIELCDRSAGEAIEATNPLDCL